MQAPLESAGHAHVYMCGYVCCIFCSDLIPCVGMCLQEQRYKEGCSLLQKGLLQLVDVRAHDEATQSSTQQHSIAVQC